MKHLSLIVTTTLAAAGVCMAQEAPKHVKNAVHGVVCSLPTDPFGYFGWPSIAKQDDGTLCVVASGLRQGHVCPWGRTTLCKSRDNGQTWTYPQVINNTPMDDRDAGIISLGGQRLAVTWFTSNSYALFDHCMGPQRNEDGTWKNPEVGKVIDSWSAEMIKKESGSFTRVSPDGEYWGESWPAPVNTPHGFIVLKDKSWLYFGKAWEFEGEGKNYYLVDGTPIRTARSTDEGRTWEILGDVPLPEGINNYLCHEPHVVELANGDLLGAVRVHKPFNVYMTRSTDGGKTWSVLEDVGCAGSPPHLLRHSSGAVICVYGWRAAGFGQRCMISYDNGNSWVRDLIIRDDGPHGDLGYPASVELADGSIMTIYYQYLPGQNKASILWSRWQLPDVAN